MTKQSKLGDLVASLKLKSNLIEEYELTASFEEKKERDQAMTLLEIIKNEMQNSLYRYSTYYPIILLLAYEINRRGITKANYHTATGDEIRKGFLEVLFAILDKVKQRKEQAVQSFNEMNTLLHRELNDEAGLVDTFLISSIFADYHIINDMKKVALDSNSLFMKELFAFLENLKTTLNNASLNFNRTVEDLIGGDFKSARNNDMKTGFTMTEEIAKSLLIPVDIVKQINEAIFEKGINKELLTEILNTMNKIHSAEDFSFVFKSLRNVFDERSKLSLRQKQLLLHHVFVIYKHPQAQTDADEERYYRINSNSSIDDFQKKKVRVIEQLVPNLR